MRFQSMIGKTALIMGAGQPAADRRPAQVREILELAV